MEKTTLSELKTFRIVHGINVLFIGPKRTVADLQVDTKKTLYWGYLRHISPFETVW